MSSQLTASSNFACLIQNAKTIYQFFSNSYQVTPALNAIQEQEAYKLRHDVFCKEFNFEEKNSLGIDRGEFDNYFRQLIVKHKI